MKAEQVDFISSYLPLARKAGESFRINPVVILAQAVIESGWGQSDLAREHHIKARDNKSTEFFKNKKLQSPISPMVLFSQKITGVVYTEGGKEVLIGASVIEVGSTNGIITDIDGEYSIGISKADKKILQASYLGYETKQE